MKFYLRRIKTYHNNTCVYTESRTMLTDETPIEKVFHVNWDNVAEIKDAYCGIGFIVWETKKGRIVEFFTNDLIRRGDKKSVREWRHPDLNVTVHVSYEEFIPSLSEILNWYNPADAIIYLRERGMDIN